MCFFGWCQHQYFSLRKKSAKQRVILIYSYNDWSDKMSIVNITLSIWNIQRGTTAYKTHLDSHFHRVSNKSSCLCNSRWILILVFAGTSPSMTDNEARSGRSLDPMLYQQNFVQSNIQTAFLHFLCFFILTYFWPKKKYLSHFKFQMSSFTNSNNFHQIILKFYDFYFFYSSFNTVQISRIRYFILQYCKIIKLEINIYNFLSLWLWFLLF